MKRCRAIQLALKASCQHNGLRNHRSGPPTYSIRYYSGTTNDAPADPAAETAESKSFPHPAPATKQPLQASKSKAYKDGSPNKLKTKKALKETRIDPLEFRELMRHIPQPVCVLTAVHYPVVKRLSDFSKHSSKPPLGTAEEKESEAVKASEKGSARRADKPLAETAAEESAGSSAKDVAEQPAESSDKFLAEQPVETSDGTESTTRTPFHQPAPHAMTISSFNSLSIYPRPKITFNIEMPSLTLHAIQGSRQFNIHVLRDSAMGARLAKHFAQGNYSPKNSAIVGTDNDLGIFNGLDKYGVTLGAKPLQRWSQLDSNIPIGVKMGLSKTSQRAAPLLQGDPVLFVLKCVLWQKTDTPKRQNDGIIVVNDGGKNHAIVIGEVQSCVTGGLPTASGKRSINSAETALAYANREYRTVREKVSTLKITKSVAVPMIFPIKNENDALVRHTVVYPGENEAPDEKYVSWLKESMDLRKPDSGVAGMLKNAFDLGAVEPFSGVHPQEPYSTIVQDAVEEILRSANVGNLTDDNVGNAPTKPKNEV